MRKRNPRENKFRKVCKRCAKPYFPSGKYSKFCSICNKTNAKRGHALHGER